MILMYGKWRVGNAFKELCQYNHIEVEVKDDADKITDFSQYEKIVPSPGIAPNHPIYQTGKVVGELDFVFSYLPKGFKIISITWTDGKSTTAWLVYSLLREEFGEEKVFLSGNFEIPFSETVMEIQKRGLKRGFIVMEISSFMGYNIKEFQSNYSIFTNLETDHLNWHSDMSDYFQAKMKVFENTTSMSIINLQVFEKAKALGLDIPELENVRFYTDKNSLLKDRIEYPHIIVSGRKKYDMRKTNFSGVHNALNILSATLVTNEMKICSKRITEYLKKITGLSHRLEFIGERDGRKFIDDSKSTSAQALKAALSSFPEKNVVLIAGWSDKGDLFEGLTELFQFHVKKTILIGQTRDILAQVAKDASVPYEFAESMNEAVAKAYLSSEKWDTILLSPGCASFGMFKDYLDRAEKFRDAVTSLS